MGRAPKTGFPETYYQQKENTGEDNVCITVEGDTGDPGDRTRITVL